MGWIMFRGVSTENLDDVLVRRMPSHKKASMRRTVYRVKGKDGELSTNEGYDPFDMDCELILFKANAVSRQVINAWADGMGRLITSDDETRAYIASVVDEIDWERDYVGGKYYDVAYITFRCQPVMREAVESTEIFTQTGAIANVGTVDSYPMIIVHGSGECVFSVGDQEITITDVDPQVPVYIDCEAGYVYTEDGATEMTGEFPRLVTGTNAVVLTSGVTQLDIRPRWGWI